jgi:hypothetical protein
MRKIRVMERFRADQVLSHLPILEQPGYLLAFSKRSNRALTGLICRRANGQRRPLDCSGPSITCRYPSLPARKLGITPAQFRIQFVKRLGPD